jgi:hypothetical protein
MGFIKFDNIQDKDVGKFTEFFTIMIALDVPKFPPGKVTLNFGPDGLNEVVQEAHWRRDKNQPLPNVPKFDTIKANPNSKL